MILRFFSQQQQDQATTHRDNLALDLEEGQVPMGLTSDLLSVQICYTIVQWRFFEGFIFGLIMINTIVLAVEYFLMPVFMFSFLEVVNQILTSLFAIEIILKLTGLGKLDL